MRCCIEINDKPREINLYDTQKYSERILKIWQCPVCLGLKALVEQYNNFTKRYEYDKPKNKKKTAEFIRQYEKEPYIEFIPVSIKQGTFSAMHWKYQRNGNIYDFNECLIEKNYTRTLQLTQKREVAR